MRLARERPIGNGFVGKPLALVPATVVAYVFVTHLKWVTPSATDRSRSRSADAENLALMVAEWRSAASLLSSSLRHFVEGFRTLAEGFTGGEADCAGSSRLGRDFVPLPPKSLSKNPMPASAKHPYLESRQSREVSSAVRAVAPACEVSSNGGNLIADHVGSGDNLFFVFPAPRFTRMFNSSENWRYLIWSNEDMSDRASNSVDTKYSSGTLPFPKIFSRDCRRNISATSAV